MLWKKNPEKSEDYSAKVSLPLNNGETVEWDLKHQPVMQMLSEDSVKMYETLAAHKAQNADHVEYYAFDLENSLLEAGAPPERLALTMHEAWDLSVALLEEVETRKAGEKGKNFIILVNNSATLLAPEGTPPFDDPEKDQKEMNRAKLEANLAKLSQDIQGNGINFLFV